MKKAVYAGSFDPITNGHLWMIKQGSSLFDELVVAVGTNPDKQYTFSLEERVRMVKNSVKDLPRISIANVDHQFLVLYAHSIGVQYILRGIRNERDYQYERGMRHINSDLCPDVVTVFFMPPREIAEVSSSVVIGMIGPKNWETIVQQYIPEAVYHVLLEKFGS
jgi:pantetheine-phosphate adenylyltransferase